MGKRKIVSDVMVADVATIGPDAALTDAAQRMRDANVGMLPIVENARLRGIVTDRDIVVRAVARGVDPAATPVRYFESEDVAHARPESSVDGERGLVGVVTLSALILRAPEPAKVLETAEEVARRSARAA